MQLAINKYADQIIFAQETATGYTGIYVHGKLVSCDESINLGDTLRLLSAVGVTMEYLILNSVADDFGEYHFENNFEDIEKFFPILTLKSRVSASPNS